MLVIATKCCLHPSFSGLNNLLMAYEDKSAYASCIFSFSPGPASEPITFVGKTPVFLPNSMLSNAYKKMLSNVFPDSYLIISI